VFKKVKLAALRFRKDRGDRKGAFEGDFINSNNKTKIEKETLSTEPLPEDPYAPDEWKVHDRFGGEILHLKIIHGDKDRMIFFADRKYYAIKVGQSLHDALARPLSDAEVKALTSKSP